MHKRVQLAANSVAPVIEYTYAYALPSDCLRVLKIHNGTTDSIKTALDYKLEGRNVVTDESTVYLIYIALDEDAKEDALKLSEFMIGYGKNVYLMSMDTKDPSDLAIVGDEDYAYNVLKEYSNSGVTEILAVVFGEDINKRINLQSRTLDFLLSINNKF